MKPSVANVTTDTFVLGPTLLQNFLQTHSSVLMVAINEDRSETMINKRTELKHRISGIGMLNSAC